MARQYPIGFFFGANEVTGLPEARVEIAKYLDLGAIIIGEQKFGVECDAAESQILYALAAEHRSLDQTTDRQLMPPSLLNPPRGHRRSS